MNYKKIYYKIIENSKTRINDINNYYEFHHIIPKCMGGDDTKDNIAILTAREHFICHQLLTKIYPNNKKLIYAVKMMTVHSTNNRSKNRLYEWVRRSFSENHPCKDAKVRNKISKSLKTYYNSKEYHRDSLKRRDTYRELRFCACGCKQTFVVYKSSKKKFIESSHAPVPDYNKVSETLKNTLSALTKENMSDRMKNSLGKANQVERGKNISKGKKGKKTNQQEIMGIRYAEMSDEDFIEYIKTKSPRVHKRIITLRNKWKNLKLNSKT
jgi:hypothetical protein